MRTAGKNRFAPKAEMIETTVSTAAFRTTTFFQKRPISMLTIQITNPRNKHVRNLIDAHIAYGNSHYPVESNHHLTADEYGQSNVQLFAAWFGNTCLGIAGLKKFSTRSGELKSMHVLATERGHGIGAKLVQHVLAHAKQQEILSVYLETGSRDASKAARNLYEKLGFSYCPPFGAYLEDPESVFMQKDIQSAQGCLA